MLKQAIVDLYMELPQCNINPKAPLLQKVKVIVGWAMELEEKVEKMDAEYKARIVELKAWEPVIPPEQRKARIEELKTASATIALWLIDAQKLLNNATATWTVMDQIPDLVIVHKQVQKIQHDLEAVTAVMKDLLPLQRMLKMGKNKKL